MNSNCTTAKCPPASITPFWIMLAAMVVAGSLPTKAQTSPVGYWKFDEGTGTVAADSSGNGNTGTLVGGPTWVPGVSGQALSFDGWRTNYVNVPNSASLGIVDD